MEKINRPLKLIGFKSEKEIKTRKPFKFGKRVYGYAAVLLVMMTVLATLLVRRSDVETTILRAAGTLYQLRDDKTVSNLYSAELVNKTNKSVNFQIKPDDPKVKIQYIQNVTKVAGGESVKVTFFIIVPQKAVKEYKSELGFKLVSGSKVIDQFTTTFMAPPNS